MKLPYYLFGLLVKIESSQVVYGYYPEFIDVLLSINSFFMPLFNN